MTREHWKDESVRALIELRRRITQSDLSQRKIEDHAGFSRGYLSQLLARNLDLKLWHVLAILDALEIPPGEFFRRVYPRSPRHAIGDFQSRSRPLSEETDDLLGRLYGHGVESLNELRERLGRCEQAVEEIAGRLAPERGSRG